MPELNLENNKEIAKPELRNENHGFDPDRRIDASSMSDTKEINEQNKFDPDMRLINPEYFDDNGKLFRTDNDLLPNNSYIWYELGHQQPCFNKKYRLLLKGNPHE